ncbi:MULTISPECIES: hypothetical protein [unclassified Xanthobacter]|uniref:hypothetical protein n=1 Tax=unclassified Xanthobacter TaxID=2623496 RepID=UPI001F39EC7E|nr:MULTISPECIES: hypothetical protein [unclassified Xanthobacter]
MTAADEFYKNAIALRGRIVAGRSNERPVQAWAAVARECAKASDAMRRELGNRVHGRAQQAWFNNLDKLWWAAKAQVETLARVG